MIPADPYNAFCRHNHAELAGVPDGPLSGLTMAVKDVFDIAGYRTGNGHPLWLETHEPAATTASAVARLVEAGADMVGKTHTDELAYSLNGENIHYGTPINPKAPDRIPGGSSSGSAVAVAGGLVDFALGTDCGGSVRLPASYCGVYGLRTSHGIVATDGVAKLAPSFDTVGWFARDAAMMRRIGSVLLPADNAGPPEQLIVAIDAFAAIPEDVATALSLAVEKLAKGVEIRSEAVAPSGSSADWSQTFRVLQGAEIAIQHHGWIDRYRPEFGPGVRERFAWTRTLDPTDVARAAVERERIADRLDALLGADAFLLLPTGPGVAPRLGTPAGELEAFRARAFALLCIAGLARLPQISLPLGSVEGLPVGLSIIAPRGRDRALLDWIAARLP
jgi:amidase